jgi:hypothetical protein
MSNLPHLSMSKVGKGISNAYIPTSIINSEYIIKKKGQILYFKVDNDEFVIICESELYVIFDNEIYIFDNNKDIINEVKNIIKIKKLENIIN